MRRHIYVALFLGMLLVLACQQNVDAQSPGAARKFEPPVAKAVKSKVEMLQETTSELQMQINRFLELRKERLSDLRKKSISDISFEEVFRMLHVQKVELAIDLEGLKARQELLEKRISSRDAKTDSADQLQRKLLKRYVANQSGNVAKASRLAEKGAIAAVTVEKSKQLLLEAQIRLTEFETQSKESSPALVDAMLEVSLEIAEKNAKQTAVEKLLQNYIESRDNFIELKKLNRSIESQSEWYSQLKKELWSLKTSDAKF